MESGSSSQSAATDWEDLQRFLPKAREADIAVWVYLVPPSESPPRTTRYSEPFRLDYVRWATEIAQLARSYPNLTAFVIDDFWGNDLFTPEYVAEMRDAAQAIHPQMAFLPLMYYPQITLDFAEAYADCIDGVVAAYPAGRETIHRARQVLDDRLVEPSHVTISYPWRTRSTPGDAAEITQAAVVEPGDRYIVQFRQKDDYVGPTAGYHFKQILIDGEAVWEEDVAQGSSDWVEVTRDVTPQVKGKHQVALTLRVMDKKGVSNFGVRASWADLTTVGLALSEGDLRSQEGWTTQRRGPWTVEFEPERGGAGRFHIPLVVMTAANARQYEKRWGKEGTSERIRDKVQMALDAMRDGECEGVVTYCLNKHV